MLGLSKVYAFVQNFILSMILPNADKSVGDYLTGATWKAIWETICNAIYGAAKWFLAFMDFLQYFIQKLIGLDYWLDSSNNGKRNLVDATEEDIIFKFLYSDSVQKVFRALIVMFILLLIIFTIYAIIKSEWDYITGGDKNGSNSKVSVFRSSLKAIAVVIVFPILLVMGIISSNAILASIINAVGVDMSDTFGKKIFAISASSANKYQYYVDANSFYPVSDQVTFYTAYYTDGSTSKEKMIVFGDGNGNVDNYKYFTSYTDYLKEISGLGTGTGLKKFTLNSIMDPLVPRETTDFDGFCFRVTDLNGDKQYYFKQVSDGTERDTVYRYLKYVLNAEILSKNSSWATDDVGIALMKALSFQSECGNTYIDGLNIHRGAEIVRKVARNSWNYSLIYMNPGRTLSQALASCGNQNLDDYDLGTTGVGAILYSSDYVSGYFDGGQFGVVQSRSEYGVMADVVNFMCDNNLTFYMIDATSTLIDWGYEDDTGKSYQIDNGWITGNTSGGKSLFEIGVENRTAGDYEDYGTILNGKTSDLKKEDYYLTFLTEYSKNGTLSCESEQQVIYTARYGVGDESQGSRYIICLKNGNYYYPLVNNKEFVVDGESYNFTSDYYANNYHGVVWAKGTFDTSSVNTQYGNPTYLVSTTSNDLDTKVDLVNNNGAYYYDIDVTSNATTGVDGETVTTYSATINYYTANTRFVGTSDSYTAYAINNGGLFQNGGMTLTLPTGDDGKTLAHYNLSKLNDPDETYIIAEGGGYTYKFTYDGIGLDESFNTRYRFKSAERGLCFVLYMDAFENVYAPTDSDVMVASGTSGTSFALKNCFTDGDKVNYTVNNGETLIVETKTITNVTLGADAGKTTKNTFSIFTGDYNDYFATFTKTSPQQIGFTMQDTEGNTYDGIKNFTKKVVLNNGDTFYNINTEGKMDDMDAFSKYFLVVSEADSVTCYRYNIKNFSGNTIGSYLLEINVYLFKSIFEIKFGTLQEVKSTPTASATFIYSGDGEGINFDYFFDQNTKLQTFYSAAHINYLLLFVASVLIIKVLFSSLWGVIKRFYMITLYYLAMPVAASTMPIDNGKRFGDVREKIIGEVLSTYGVLIGLNVFFVVLSPIRDITSTIFTEEIIANSGSYFLKKLPITAKMLNEYVYILFLLVAFTLIGELPAFVQGLVGKGKDLNATGKDVKKNAKDTLKESSEMISGKTFKNSLKDTVTMVPGLLPGSTLIKDGAKLTGKGIKALGKAFGSGRDEADNGPGGGGDGQGGGGQGGGGQGNNRQNFDQNGQEGGGGQGSGNTQGGGQGNNRQNFENENPNPMDDDAYDNNSHGGQGGSNNRENFDENGEDENKGSLYEELEERKQQRIENAEINLKNTENDEEKAKENAKDIDKELDNATSDGDLDKIQKKIAGTSAGKEAFKAYDDYIKNAEKQGRPIDEGVRKEALKAMSDASVEIAEKNTKKAQKKLDVAENGNWLQKKYRKAKNFVDNNNIIQGLRGNRQDTVSGALLGLAGKSAKVVGITALTLANPFAGAGVIAGGFIAKKGIQAGKKFMALGKEERTKLVKKWGGRALKVAGGVGVAALTVANPLVGAGVLAGGFLGKKAFKMGKQFKQADQQTRAKLVTKWGGNALKVAGIGALGALTGGAGLALVAGGATIGLLVAKNYRGKVKRTRNARRVVENNPNIANMTSPEGETRTGNVNRTAQGENVGATNGRQGEQKAEDQKKKNVEKKKEALDKANADKEKAQTKHDEIENALKSAQSDDFDRIEKQFDKKTLQKAIKKGKYNPNASDDEKRRALMALNDESLGDASKNVEKADKRLKRAKKRDNFAKFVNKVKDSKLIRGFSGQDKDTVSGALLGLAGKSAKVVGITALTLANPFAGAGVIAGGFIAKKGIQAGKKFMALGKEERTKLVKKWGGRALKVAGGVGVAALTVANPLVGAGVLAGGFLGKKAFKMGKQFKQADQQTRAKLVTKWGGNVLKVAGIGALGALTGGAGLALVAGGATSGLLLANHYRGKVKASRNADEVTRKAGIQTMTSPAGATGTGTMERVANGETAGGQGQGDNQDNQNRVKEIIQTAQDKHDKIATSLENVKDGKELKNIEKQLGKRTIKKAIKKGMYDPNASVEERVKALKALNDTKLEKKKERAENGNWFTKKYRKVENFVNNNNIVQGLLGNNQDTVAGAMLGLAGKVVKGGAIVGLGALAIANPLLGLGVIGTGVLGKKGLKLGKQFVNANSKDRAKYITKWGGNTLKVATVAGLGLATSGASLALMAGGGTAGVLAVGHYANIRSNKAKSQASDENSYVGSGAGNAQGGTNVTGTHSVAQTHEVIVHHVMDDGSGTANLIRSAMQGGYVLEGAEKMRMARMMANNESIDDTRFVANKGEAFRNVVVNTIGHKGSRVVAGDVIANYATANNQSMQMTMLGGNIASENGAMKHVDGLISDKAKVELYKSMMSGEQLSSLEEFRKKNKVEATDSELLKFIESDALYGNNKGLGMHLNATYNAETGVGFEVNGMAVRGTAGRNDAVNGALTEALRSDRISTESVQTSLKKNGYIRNAEVALSTNYALGVNYQAETIGNVNGSSYHESVFENALKDENIVAEAILAYLKKNPALFEQFKTEHGSAVEKATDSEILEFIKADRSSSVQNTINSLETEKFSGELSGTIAKHVADNSFNVQAFDLISRAEQLAYADRMAVNIGAISSGAGYALTEIEKLRELVLSTQNFGNAELIHSFMNSGIENKDQIVNTIVGKHFGFAGEDGNVDMNSAEAEKLLAEIEGDSELARAKLDLTSKANYTDEEVLLAYAKAKLAGNVTADGIKNGVGNALDSQVVEAMVNGRKLESVQVTDEYFEELHREKVGQLAKTTGKTEEEIYASDTNQLVMDTFNIAHNGDQIDTKSAGYQNLIKNISNDKNQEWHNKLNSFEDVTSTEAQQIVMAYAKAVINDETDEHEKYIGDKPENEFDINTRVNGFVQDMRNNANAETYYNNGLKQEDFARAYDNFKARYLTQEVAGSEDKNEKQVADMLRTLLSEKQINELTNTGANNGFIALSQARQNAILANFAINNASARVELTRNNVDLSSVMEVSQFLNSAKGEELKQKLISSISGSLLALQARLVGLSEQAVFNIVRNNASMSQNSQVIVGQQGSLISNERVKQEMTQNSGTADAKFVVREAGAKLELLTKEETETVKLQGTYDYLKKSSPSEIAKAEEAVRKENGNVTGAEFQKLVLEKLDLRLVKTAQAVGGNKAVIDAKVNALSGGGLDRQRAVASVVMSNDEYLKQVARKYSQDSHGGSFEGLSDVDKNNYIFSNFSKIFAQNSDARKDIDAVLNKSKVDLSTGSNETALKNLNQTEFDNIVKNMGKVGESIVERSKQNIVQKIVESGEVTDVPDTSKMSKEELAEYNQNKSLLQQFHVKNNNSEEFANLYRNITLVNEDESIRQILSGVNVNASPEDIEKAKLEALKNNQDYYGKAIVAVMNQAQNQKALQKIIEKLQKDGVDYNALSNAEKGEAITRLLKDKEFTGKDINAGKLTTSFEAELKTRSATASNNEIKMGLTSEQIHKFLNDKAGTQTREKLIEVGASRPQEIFNKQLFERVKMDYALNNPVTRQIIVGAGLKEKYTEPQIRQIIKKEMLDPASALHDPRFKSMTEAQINNYINSHFDALKNKLGTQEFLNKDENDRFAFNSQVDFNTQSRMMSAAEMDPVYNKTTGRASKSLFKKALDAFKGAREKKEKEDKEINELFDRLVNKMKSDDKAKKKINEIVKTSLNSQINSFFEGYQVKELMRKNIKKTVKEPEMKKAIFSSHNNNVDAEIKRVSAELNRLKVAYNKAKNGAKR